MKVILLQDVKALGKKKLNKLNMKNMMLLNAV